MPRCHLQPRTTAPPRRRDIARVALPMLLRAPVALLVAVACTLAALTVGGRAEAGDGAEALSSKEAKACMSCHAKPGLVAVYKDNERRAVTITEEHFRDSAHKFLPCTGCHTGLPATGMHAKSAGTTREQVSLEVAATCRRCHGADQLNRNPLHKQILATKTSVRCADCHGSHGIQRVWRLKSSSDLNQYCLVCHKHTLESASAGEFSSLQECGTDLRASVHCNHSCTDCHKTMSKDDHPVFETRRALDLAVADACAGCHAEKYQAYKGSVHANMVKAGNGRAPVCTDCHGSHQVGTRALFDTLAGEPCKKCHGDIEATYVDSVHGAAREAGSQAAARCSSCHFAHEIKPAIVSRATRMACAGCHADVVVNHRKWLPNVEVHFDTVSCVACHVPNAPRAVYLQVTGPGGDVLPEAEIKKQLGRAYDDLLASSVESIEGPQLWELYKLLNREGAEGAGMSGTLALRDGLQAHGLVRNEQAIKRCETCHSTGSDYFQSVLMVVPRPDGTEQFYQVSPNVLQSVFSTLPLKHFYAMGNTRMRVLDWGGLVLGAGVLLGLAGHMGLRFAARRRLRARKGSR